MAEEAYPQSCPFCNIVSTYKYDKPSRTSNSVPYTSSIVSTERLLNYVPTHHDANKTIPACHLILSSPDVLAFLDIMPMSAGHVLLVSREHRAKLADVPIHESQEIGFWLPLVSAATMKAVGATDWNVVQNNGPRAAQVVPHVHFHIIPRMEDRSYAVSKSWTMFGRGGRGDLDDDEGEKIASSIREALREVIKAITTPKSSI